MRLPDRRHLLQMPTDHPAVRIVLFLSVALAIVSVMSYRSSQQLISQRHERKLLASTSGSTDLHCGQPGAAPKSLIALQSRNDLPQLLEAEGLTVGAELGVQLGLFAAHTLKTWKSCTKYYLVDLWAQQDNYFDGANVDNSEQEQRYQETRARLQQWRGKTEYLRMYTTEAAKQIPDDSLDYVYVDARHDYCGVMEDLVAYWPKLRSGGIFAGHDYVTADHPVLLRQKEDWGTCQDGTVNRGAVKGAVDEFAIARGLIVTVTYREDGFPSWVIRKP